MKYLDGHLMKHLMEHFLVGRMTIGEYDGEHPCLTAATIGDKVKKEF